MAHILIIEDDSAVCDYLATLMDRLGHRATKAATFADGLELMADPGINIIISDIFLPDSPPFHEWLTKLKSHAAGRPLILITGEPSEEFAAKVRGEGITAFLTKPFELAFIKGLLARLGTRLGVSCRPGRRLE